jgi:hypothetical protein
MAVSGVSQADLITPDVIFGSGNVNGDFTVSTGVYDAGAPNTAVPLEIGLRAKLRFNESNSPENTFNFDGIDTYTFAAGTSPLGFGFAPNSPGTAIWNFEWSVNTDTEFALPAAGFTSLDALTYELRLDGDASAGVNFLTFDPISVGFADHAIGNNSTGNGNGLVAVDAADYAALLNSNQVAQNSWNYEFFNNPGTALENFIGADPGEYRIEFEAFYQGQSVAMTGININSVASVSAPATLSLFAGVLLGFGWLRRRKG